MTDVMDFCTHPRSVHICSRIYQIWKGKKTDAVKEECIMKDGPGVVCGRKANCTDGEVWSNIFKAFPSTSPANTTFESVPWWETLGTARNWFGLERGTEMDIFFLYSNISASLLPFIMRKMSKPHIFFNKFDLIPLCLRKHLSVKGANSWRLLRLRCA